MSALFPRPLCSSARNVFSSPDQTPAPPPSENDSIDSEGPLAKRVMNATTMETGLGFLPKIHTDGSLVHLEQTPDDRTTRRNLDFDLEPTIDRAPLKEGGVKEEDSSRRFVPLLPQLRGSRRDGPDEAFGVVRKGGFRLNLSVLMSPVQNQKNKPLDTSPPSAPLRINHTKNNVMVCWRPPSKMIA